MTSLHNLLLDSELDMNLTKQMDKLFGSRQSHRHGQKRRSRSRSSRRNSNSLYGSPKKKSRSRTGHCKPGKVINPKTLYCVKKCRRSKKTERCLRKKRSRKSKAASKSKSASTRRSPRRSRRIAASKH